MKDKLVSALTRNFHGGMEVQLQWILALARVWGECSTTCPRSFTCADQTAICQQTGGSASPVWNAFFWDAEGLILAEFLETGQTITAARYVQTLHKPRRALRDKRSGRNIIILHDNARPHTARLTSETTAKMGWEVLPHHSYSPDLAPSDYHLFGFVKDQLRGQRYETTEAIQKAVRQCLWMAGTEFYRRGIFKLPERWKKCV